MRDGHCRYDAIFCNIVFTGDGGGGGGGSGGGGGGDDWRRGRVVVQEQRVFHFHFSGLKTRKTNRRSCAFNARLNNMQRIYRAQALHSVIFCT